MKFSIKDFFISCVVLLLSFRIKTEVFRKTERKNEKKVKRNFNKNKEESNF